MVYGGGTRNHLVREYLTRKRMATLGFTTDISKVPAWKIDALMIIDSEMDKIVSDKSERESKTRGKRK